MSQNTELRERYAALVEAKLRSTSVFANLFNNRYEGDPKAGAVKVPVRADSEVKSYVIDSGASLTATSTTYATIILDQDKAVNELIDGYVAAAVPDDIVADRLDSAAYGLNIAIDSYLCGLLEATSGNSVASTTETDVYKQMIDTIAQARKAHVQKADMWFVVSPNTYAALLKCDAFIGAAHIPDLQVGQVGAIGGVPVFESDNMNDKTDFILGNRAWCHVVKEFVVNPDVVDLADGVHIGACAVQGRYVFGGLVSKKATVFRKSHT